MDQDNDEFTLPEDLQDVEIIYSDNEDEGENFGNEQIEDEEIKDLSSLTFNSHEKSVFAVDISPNGKYVVTGGEDDMAFVWDINTKEILLTCIGHKDSVTQAAFNHDGKYVATGDMSGLINVWNLLERKLEWTSEMGDLEWMQWHGVANVLIAGYNSGEIYIWQIPNGNCKVLPSHGHVSTCGKILPDGVRLLAGYEDGSIKLWDLKTTNLLWKKMCNAGITSLDVNSDSTLLAIAPTSELALISDGKNVVTLKCNTEDDIEAILVRSELGVIITGSISGQVCIWNLSKHILRHKIDIGCAVTVMKLSSNNEVLIGAADGVIYVCDIINGTLAKVLSGHVDGILDIAVPKSGNFFVSSSDDTTVKVFSL